MINCWSRVHLVQYPEWLANVVLVPKQGGKWRLCVDFTNLNKACPKDQFLLPRVDILVDSTSGCEMLSFLDAYQGYKQIKLAPEDQENANFVTDQDIFCYEVMPFGFKNTRATYQRLVNTMFSELIGRNMEVYIDDMLVKSPLATKHMDNLAECFKILHAYRMKLNPSKCVFSVHGGKFLGYMVLQRGIEVNPKKIEAIMKLPPPQTTRDVQRLAGSMAALNRFITRFTDKGLPFFKTLRGVKNFTLTRECQQAFEGLKRYLSNPLLLTKPEEGEILLLYLAKTWEAVSVVLVREVGRYYKPIYYVSSTLQGVEQRYSTIERLALAFVTAARKLRPYFQSHDSHPIMVLTNLPLQRVMSSLETSGRMVKWAMELSQHDVEFRPRPVIKAQVLAYFVVEMSGAKPSGSLPTWIVHVDGSSTASEGGVGVVLHTPKGISSNTP